MNKLRVESQARQTYNVCYRVHRGIQHNRKEFWELIPYVREMTFAGCDAAIAGRKSFLQRFVKDNLTRPLKDRYKDMPLFPIKI